MSERDKRKRGRRIVVEGPATLRRNRPRYPRTGTPWTPAEVDWLRENYEQHTDHALSKILGRRASTIKRRRKELKFYRIDRPEENVQPEGHELFETPRPSKRGECPHVRPCPFVGCRYHLYLEVRPDGAIIINFPDSAPHEIDPSCALDVAADGSRALEAVGDALNLTRERVRQIEAEAIEKISREPDSEELLGLMRSLAWMHEREYWPGDTMDGGEDGEL